MRRFVFLLMLITSVTLVPHTARAAAAEPIASYRIQARLDPAAKTVTGTERITYRNPSGDTLREIWLHLYLNAFRNFDTLWAREAGGESRGYRVDPNKLGGIDVASLKLADGTDLLATSSVSETLMRVPLPTPLGPNLTVQLDVAWTAKLPRVFARTGYGGPQEDFFMVGQWYPKMAVYFNGQWDSEPWHANAEFFHDIGDYDLEIDVPQNYVVGAVGLPHGERAGGDGRKIVSFHADTVSDVAFAASPHFKTLSGKAGTTTVDVYYLPENAGIAQAYLHTATNSLLTFGQWYGAYPHPRLVVIDVPDDAEGAGGMEYPMLITGGSLGGQGVAVVTAHEVGHQWWPMQTLTNEAREPWLDEGITQYSGARYNDVTGDGIRIGPFNPGGFWSDQLGYAFDPAQPATLPAWEYGSAGYGTVYSKSALAFWTLESVVGTERFHTAMQRYLQTYQWQHPTGADFKRSLETSLGNLTWFWTLLDTSGVIDYTVRDVRTAKQGNGYQSSATLVRVGGVPAPVDWLATFADGTTQRATWDASTDSQTLIYTTPTPLVRVEADPDHKLKSEINTVDNGYSVQAETAATTKIGSRFLFWLQTLLQTLGTLG